MSAATLQLGAPLNNTFAIQANRRILPLTFHSMGVMLIGVIISAVLHGITLVQCYYYFACKNIFCHTLVI